MARLPRRGRFGRSWRRDGHDFRRVDWSLRPDRFWWKHSAGGRGGRFVRGTETVQGIAGCLPTGCRGGSGLVEPSQLLGGGQPPSRHGWVSCGQLSAL